VLQQFKQFPLVTAAKVPRGFTQYQPNAFLGGHAADATDAPWRGLLTSALVASEAWSRRN